MNTFLEGKQLAVIGDPVGHSLSPVIQQAMLDALGISCTCRRISVPAGATAQWLASAEKSGLAGFNATMPHKTALVPLMDTLSGDAGMYGAVNTVVLRDGKRHGFNTDGEGFLRSLRRRGIAHEGKNIVLLGAGGAARAVALKLAASGAGKITVLCRTPQKALPLVQASPRVSAAAMDRRTLRHGLESADLLINCTPLGMAGVAAQFEDFSFLDWLPLSSPVCDVIYRPQKTLLLQEAGRRGHAVMNGLGMLIHQGILALEHFSGISLDVDAMEKTIEARLLPVLG